MRLVGLFVLLVTSTPLFAAGLPAVPLAAEKKAGQPGDIAWMLVSTGLVLLMVPGLALFYGGMVRAKNILGTMMQSMVCLALVGVQWVLVGYSMAFGQSQGGWLGWSPEFLGLNDPSLTGLVFPSTRLPIALHCLYQGMFAIITPALISGAIAERVKFGPYCAFCLIWAILVYNPLAHWVWALDADGNAAGWLGKMGALDFAGGTVVHVAAGFSGLAAILVLRKRVGFPERVIGPSSMVLTLLGSGILWFGWFGFNGGSALSANPLAVFAVTASQLAAAAAGTTWTLAEWWHRGKPTGLGLASGIVAGLVAVTPASGFVTPLAALAIGAIAGPACYAMVALKPKFKYDDSLDAFGVHGVGGFLGAILTGVFASAALFKAGADADIGSELLRGTTPDRLGQVWIQFVAAAAAAAYSFAVTLVVVKLIDVTVGFTLDPRTEIQGLDRGVHGEPGFDLDDVDEMAVEMHSTPRAASQPPAGGKRFTVVCDSPHGNDLGRAWAAICQSDAATDSPEFKSIYPYFTTVTGNHFRFRGGDPVQHMTNLQRLFADHLDGAAIKTHIEG